MNHPVEGILRQLGSCVLLSIPRGQKAPKGKHLKDWPTWTVDMMTPQYLASLNHGNNIGVSLGKPSDRLCTIDFDNDALLEEFLELNPDLRETLISKGARGGNVWVRITGDYPKSCKLVQKQDREKVGEWRADGNQTVIYGQHPKGAQLSQ